MQWYTVIPNPYYVLKGKSKNCINVLKRHTANEGPVKIQFQFMYSQKWNCAALLFPKQNYNVLYPSFHIPVSENDSQDRSVYFAAD